MIKGNTESKEYICKHCGHTEDVHSVASRLCPGKLKHFEPEEPSPVSFRKDIIFGFAPVADEEEDRLPEKFIQHFLKQCGCSAYLAPHLLNQKTGICTCQNCGETFHVNGNSGLKIKEDDDEKPCPSCFAKCGECDDEEEKVSISIFGNNSSLFFKGKETIKKSDLFHLLRKTLHFDDAKELTEIFFEKIFKI